MTWYGRAAELGYGPACYAIGILHCRGRVALGIILEEGNGVPVDPVHAGQLYSDAVTRGHLEAPYRLGRLYDFGNGVV